MRRTRDADLRVPLRTCHKKTTALVLVRPQETNVRCAHYGGANLNKLVSRFATPTSEESRLDRLSDQATFSGVYGNDPQRVVRWMKKIGREMGETVGENFG